MAKNNSQSRPAPASLINRIILRLTNLGAEFNPIGDWGIYVFSGPQNGLPEYSVWLRALDDGVAVRCVIEEQTPASRWTHAMSFTAFWRAIRDFKTKEEFFIFVNAQLAIAAALEEHE